MAELYEHLELPFYQQTYDRQTRGGGGGAKKRPAEQKKEFYKVQTQQFRQMKESLDRDKLRYKEYLDPSLIFKLDVVQAIDEEELRTQLRRMKVEVISPSPDKKGLWVVFAEDENLELFKDKLKAYGDEEKQYGFFDAIGTMGEIPVEEKTGPRLKEITFRSDETTYLDVEIWRMDNGKLYEFLKGLERLIENKGGKITDRLIKRSFCLLRILTNKDVLDLLLPLREVALVDRPPKPYIEYRMLTLPLEDFDIESPPSENATAIAILDSGIRSKHPLLEKAVGDETVFTSKSKDEVDDNTGHGTQVAGIALYGDIKQCIENTEFVPEVWILSGKVMYAEEDPATGKMESKYDEEELLEHQLEKAVRYFVQNYSNCKVINLSLGDPEKRMFGEQHQFNMAALIDELAKELRVVFVVSTGNFFDFHNRGFPDTYPGYLLEETQDVKIIDPATAALALTVGSVAQEYGPSNTHNPQHLLHSPAKTNYPSPFTRVGMGYKGMIKPELVEEGGNVIEGTTEIADLSGKLVTINANWVSEGKLFTVDFGTSFSAPKVANHIAKLLNKYPDYSPNLAKAILISSAKIPDERPEPLSEISYNASATELTKVLKVYGFGKPDIENALFSSNSRALLLRDNRIKADSVHVFYLYLPDDFVGTSGTRTLSITLVYDPPTNKNRMAYFGCSMEYHLFRDSEINEVVQAYKSIKISESEEEALPEGLKLKEIKLSPGVNLRKKGVHQKATIRYRRKPQFDIAKPLVLVVVCQNRWIKDTEYEQDYGIVVTLEHSEEIDLFNKVRLRNQERVRVTLGPR